MKNPCIAALTAFLLLVSSGQSVGQQLFIYPAQGQSQEQLGKDRYECHTWAVQQTGFDPTNPQTAQAPVQSAPPPPSEPRQGGLLRGAARGAAVGAVGGAIAGDAGKGAGIGAATGALMGGFRRRDQQRRQAHQHQQWQQQQAQVQAQQQQAMASQRNNYNRAMSSCLTARGYTVN